MPGWEAFNSRTMRIGEGHYLIRNNSCFSIPIWIKWLITYILIIVLTAGILSPVYIYAIRQSEQHALSQVEQTLEEWVTCLDEDLAIFVQAQVLMAENTAFSALKNAAGDRMASLAAMELDSSSLLSMEHLAEYNPSISNVFYWFSNHSFVLTQQGEYLPGDPVLGQVLPSEPSPAQMRLLVVEKAPRPGQTVGYLIETQECDPQLLVILPLGNASGVAYACALVDFPPVHLRNGDSGATIEIKDTVGNTLTIASELSDGLLTPKKDDLQITSSLPSLEWQVKIILPQTYIQQNSQPLGHIILLCLGLALLAGGLLSWFFTHSRYRPLRRLAFAATAVAGLQEKARDAYALIGDALNKLQTENRQYKQAELRNLLYGIENKDKELSLAEEILPPDGLSRIALLEMEPEHGRITTALTDALPIPHISATLDSYSIAILFADNPTTPALLSQWEKTLKDSPTARLGISAPLQEACQISIAYRQAKYALLIPDLTLANYQQLPQTSGNIPDYAAIQNIYTLASVGDTQLLLPALTQHFTSLASQQACQMHLAEETAYVLRFMLRTILLENNLPLADFPLPNIHENSNLNQLFRDLHQSYCRVSQAVAQQRTTGNQAINGAVLEYIRANCADPDLYAETISDEFSLSKQHIYRIVREGTGRSFGVYLEELRMEKAEHLLRTTDLLVAEVSEACGYISINTFYRVFKKRFGVTPSTYRSQDA